MEGRERWQEGATGAAHQPTLCPAALPSSQGFTSWYSEFLDHPRNHGIPDDEHTYFWCTLQKIKGLVPSPGIFGPKDTRDWEVTRLLRDLFDKRDPDRPKEGCALM